MANDKLVSEHACRAGYYWPELYAQAAGRPIRLTEIKMINSYIKRNRWILLQLLKCAYIFYFFLLSFSRAVFVSCHRECVGKTPHFTQLNAYRKGDQTNIVTMQRKRRKKHTHTKTPKPPTTYTHIQLIRT